MIKAVIFDSNVFDFSIASSARKAGVKLAVVTGTKAGICPSGFDGICVDEDALARQRPEGDAYWKAACDMGVEASECVVFTKSNDGLKAARNARMTVYAVGSDHYQSILDGADCVYDNMSLFPKFSSVEEFSDVIDCETRSCYDATVIGKVLKAASTARLNAYAPYSRFTVGAAIMTDSGAIYKGCNVENASFGGTICAERGAAMAAICAEGARKFRLIAIVSGADDPAPPCAICRQFLSEFTSPDAQVYLYSEKSKVLRHYNFGTLMPYTFTEF